MAAAFKDAPDLATARRRLTDALGKVAFDAQAQAGRVDSETGWAYMGIDLSPAPLKDVSIGAAIENLTTLPIGSSGTLTAAATITSAIKEIQVKQTGYSGLMLPILEDSRLAQRWSEGRISIDALLSYSAVCGTGLDTVPLAGGHQRRAAFAHHRGHGEPRREVAQTALGATSFLSRARVLGTRPSWTVSFL